VRVSRRGDLHFNWKWSSDMTIFSGWEDFPTNSMQVNTGQKKPRTPQNPIT